MTPGISTRKHHRGGKQSLLWGISPVIWYTVSGGAVSSSMSVLSTPPQNSQWTKKLIHLFGDGLEVGGGIWGNGFFSLDYSPLPNLYFLRCLKTPRLIIQPCWQKDDRTRVRASESEVSDLSAVPLRRADITKYRLEGHLRNLVLTVLNAGRSKAQGISISNATWGFSLFVGCLLWPSDLSMHSSGVLFLLLRARLIVD